MKKIYSLTVALAATLGLASCHDNWSPDGPDNGGKGQLAISSIDVVNGENVISRASSVDVSNFIVTINSADGAIAGQWKYSEMPELITLPVAEGYTATVISHNQEKAAWEAPYFEGVSEKFNIENNKITQIGTVSCSLANIKVSIRFTDALKKAMGDDCKVTVIANDEGRLEFTADETRCGYFQAVEGSSTLIATFTGTVSGYNEEVRKIYTDVAAGQHRIITYSLKTGDGEVPDETGTIDPSTGISVDISTIDETVEGGVIVDEDIIDGERPGQEDPEDPENPDQPDVPDNPDDPKEDLFKFENGEGSEIDFNGVNQAEYGKSYIVDITSVNPLAHLEVEIISQSLDEDGLAEVGLPASFDLADPQPFTKPDGEVVDLEEVLSGTFGFPVKDGVVGQTNVTFDISQFVPLLLAFPDEVHTFKLTLTDEKGNQEVLNLSFKS